MIIISRIVAAFILGVAGYQLAKLAEVEDALPITSAVRTGTLILIGMFTGLAVGGLVGKWVQRGLRPVVANLRERSGAELTMGAIGLMLGLIVALLVGLALRPLGLLGALLLAPILLVVAYVFTEIAAAKHAEILRLAGVRVERSGAGAPGKLLDTSVLIDGRISDIVGSGFLEGELVVPVFVLEELQRVADSSDELRRARGRRGLDVVNRLRKARLLTSPDDDYPDLSAVDSKLVRMARDNGYSILTTDFNLNKVAQIQQVQVLNINQLANALKPDFVPGETFDIKVIREGKEADQGVGYLDDGTMVVIERGRQYLGTVVNVEVTSMLQSPSGKLVFTRVGTDKGGAAAHA